MKICFNVGGRKFCIWVPVLIWPWWWHRPNGNGDPWKHLGDWITQAEPSPDPWKQNLPIVATVATLAKHAEGDLRGRLEEVVRAETAEIQKQLPEGATLEFK
jgi:hypothetical protein